MSGGYTWYSSLSDVGTGAAKSSIGKTYWDPYSSERKGFGSF